MPDQLQYEVKVLRTLEEAERMRSVWSAMQWSPESDIDFVSFIVDIRPEIIRPHVVVVLEASKPVALLAGRLENSHFEIKFGYKVLWRTKIRRIAMFYGGFMGKTDATIGEVVIQSLLRSLRDEKASLLLWNGVQRDSILHTLLSDTPNSLCRDRLTRFVQHWTMKMPASLDELLHQRMNKKQRYNAKRSMQMIEKEFPGQVRYANYSTPNDVDELFQNAFKIARMTYQWGLGVGFQGSKENKERLVLEAKKGWFRGCVLFVKNEPVAFWICTVYNGIVYMDYTGYDPGFRNYEVGTALFLHMVGELCRDNVKQLDFGPGTAFYKEQFGDASFDEATLCVFSSSVRGMVLCGLNFAARGTVELARVLLKRLGLEQKLKTIWRRSATPAAERKEQIKTQVPVTSSEGGGL